MLTKSIELCFIFVIILFTIFTINSAATIARKNLEESLTGVEQENPDLGKTDFSLVEGVTQTPKYAQELFDLLSVADEDGDGVITKNEYFVWSAGLKFSEEEAQSQFDGIDTNGDDVMTLEEYVGWVNQFFTNSKAYIRETFKDADENMDGKVTRAEYIKWHQSFENTSDVDAELEYLDDDRDQDGVITVKDFEMSTFVRAADANGDGVLSLNEYLGQTLRYLPSTVNPDNQTVKDEMDFKEMDTDRDGFISLKELEDDMR